MAANDKETTMIWTPTGRPATYASGPFTIVGPDRAAGQPSSLGWDLFRDGQFVTNRPTLKSAKSRASR